MKTCFGCCPLNQGVTAIAFLNIVWNIMEALKHIYRRVEEYDRYKLMNISSTSVSPDDNITAEYDAPDYWSDIEKVPVMSEIYMDYVFIIAVGWIVLEFISNCCLKQSTFKRAPQKIYLWLVIYYANLLFMVFHLVHYTILMMTNSILANAVFTIRMKRHLGHLFTNLFYIALISLEIAIIQSYYISEKKNMLNDIIQLKWKCVSRGKVVSKGVDYSTSSAFNERTSGQTEDGSRIPPYITNVIEN